VANIRFIEVKSEIGAGTRGASMGVDALKTAALDFGSFLFSKVPATEVKNENQLLFEMPKQPYAKRIDGLISVCNRISEAIVETVKQRKFPVVLAGDHSTAAGTISGIKAAYPESRLGVIWIDAHADMHSPFTTPSGNMHGMPLSVVLGEDNMECKINEPDAHTIESWEKLKNLGGISPKIQYSDLVFIGLRDLEPEETLLLKRNKVKVIPVSEIKRNGVEMIAKDALLYLSACTHIYISFDVDSMDAAISKGTGTPVRNGITEKEAGSLCVRLIQNAKVCCFEICEINPTLDTENLMAENAFEIMQRVVSHINY
jgi:arginase